MHNPDTLHKLKVVSLVLGMPLMAAIGCGADAASDSRKPTAGSDAGADSGMPAVHYDIVEDGGALLFPDGGFIYLSLKARPCPDASTLTYESFGQEFVGHYCTHCHGAGVTGVARGGAPAGLNFDTLAEVRDQAARIWEEAADTNRDMPQAGARPTVDERHQLGEWLACGARSESDAVDDAGL